MSRATITLRHNADRLLAVRWIEQAPVGTRVDFKAAKRSLDQNALMWSRCTDLSVQLRWHGKHLTANDWKIMALSALSRESRVVPNMDGDGFVDLGRSSSDLSKEEMSNLLDLLAAFGAQHGVIFNDGEATSIAPDMPAERVTA